MQAAAAGTAAGKRRGRRVGRGAENRGASARLSGASLSHKSRMGHPQRGGVGPMQSRGRLKILQAHVRPASLFDGTRMAKRWPTSRIGFSTVVQPDDRNGVSPMDADVQPAGVGNAVGRSFRSGTGRRRHPAGGGCHTRKPTGSKAPVVVRCGRPGAAPSRQPAEFVAVRAAHAGPCACQCASTRFTRCAPQGLGRQARRTRRSRRYQARDRRTPRWDRRAQQAGFRVERCLPSALAPRADTHVGVAACLATRTRAGTRSASRPLERLPDEVRLRTACAW